MSSHREAPGRCRADVLSASGALASRHRPILANDVPLQIVLKACVSSLTRTCPVMTDAKEN